MSSRIHGIVVQNVLRVEHVELKPKPSGITVIAGANGQGKSSVLRAVELAVEYKAASRKVADPLRDGQQKGWTELDLGDGVKVRRTFTPGGKTTLTVKRDGKPVSSPQGFLDAIRPPDLLDPLAFSDMSPADRRRLMIGVAGLGEQLEAADVVVTRAEEERLESGREDRALRSRLEAMPDAPEGTPAEAVSASDLLERLQEFQLQQRTYEEAAGRSGNLKAALASALNAETTARRALEGATAVRAEAERVCFGADQALQDLKEPNREDWRQLDVQVASVDETNRNVALRKQKEQAQENSKWAKDASDSASAAVATARAKRDLLVKDAKMPLPLLGFDSEDATYRGVRWASLGTAEQLQIGLALGLAQHPGLLVFSIHRGESLDAASYEIVDQWVEQNEVQVLMEIVGGEDRDGAFVLEAGRLKGATP